METFAPLEVIIALLVYLVVVFSCKSFSGIFSFCNYIFSGSCLWVTVEENIFLCLVGQYVWKLFSLGKLVLQK